MGDKIENPLLFVTLPKHLFSLENADSVEIMLRRFYPKSKVKVMFFGEEITVNDRSGTIDAELIATGIYIQYEKFFAKNKAMFLKKLNDSPWDEKTGLGVNN